MSNQNTKISNGVKDKILFIFSRFHADPKNIHHKCGTGVAQLEILGVLENLGYDVYFGGQEDSSYPIDYIKDSKAIIYIAPALPKFIKHNPKGKLILFANNTHVLVRNRRMSESAAKWGLPVESLGPEKLFLEAYQKSHYIMVAGNDMVNQAMVENGVPGEKIAYWHNSVDAEIYKPAEKKYEQFTFTHWSSELGLRKGMPAILAAWKKWNNPNARLILMGIVTKVGKKLLYRRNMFGWLKLNLPKNVLLYKGGKMGYPSQDPFVREVLGKSHVGVFPTLEDNQPASAMEMAASGLPMILTQESGFKLDPSWSWEVKRDDVDSLVSAFDAAYGEKNLAEKSQNARKHMLEHHSWPDFEKSFGDFITKILK